MMPTENITCEISTRIPNMHLDVSPFELEIEEERDLCIDSSLKHPLKVSSSDALKTIGTCEALNRNSNDETSIGKSETADKDSYSFSNSIANSKVPMFFEQNLKTYSFVQHPQYKKKTILELEDYSLKELHQLIEDLTNTVEAVSSELVQLLLDNDSLQQESDARNVAIEQLLKLTVKNTENELRPIQMSVILPSNETDDDSDQVDES